MKLSRFQVKLTAAFVLLLTIPTILLALLASRLVTYGVDFLAGERIASSLQGAMIISHRLVQKEMDDVLLAARRLAEDAESAKGSEAYLSAKRGQYGLASVQVIGFNAVSPTGENPPEDVLLQISRMQRSRKPSPFSLHEGSIVYGVVPIVKGGKANKVVTASKLLDTELAEGVDSIKESLRIYSQLGSIKRDIKRLIWPASVVIVAVLVATGTAASALFARSITRPITSLVAGTQEIAQGNLDHRVKAKSKDEIGILIDSFNKMTQDLKENREKLLRAERLAAWRDVARTLAHEIKNPLTPIQLSIHRLGRRLDRSDHQYAELFDECAAIIDRQVESLRRMAREFSQFARMPKPELKPKNVNPIVNQALKLHAGMGTDIRLNVHLRDNLPETLLDEDQIRQALLNLIQNAIEAMPEGGELGVKADIEGDRILIEISDTGVGMPPEVKDRIFDPYFTTKRKGTGLGMAIVGRIVEAHDGQVEVESWVEIGTTVSIRLPVKTG